MNLSTLLLLICTFIFRYWIIPLHSMITLAEQSKVFKIPPPDHRKVLIVKQNKKQKKSICRKLSKYVRQML